MAQGFVYGTTEPGVPFFCARQEPTRNLGLEPHAYVIRYLDRYLGHIHARTVVIEPQYNDADYLDDYASYYVRCFPEYPRFCRRIHFFSSRFNEKHLEKAILSKDDSAIVTILKRSYLGFVVGRPLSITVVGRTLVSNYPTDKNRQHFPSSGRYNVRRRYDGNRARTPERNLSNTIHLWKDKYAGLETLLAFLDASKVTERIFQVHLREMDLRRSRGIAQRSFCVVDVAPRAGELALLFRSKCHRLCYRFRPKRHNSCDEARLVLRSRRPWCVMNIEHDFTRGRDFERMSMFAWSMQCKW